MSAAIAHGHPDVTRVYVHRKSLPGEWLSDRYPHAPFGREGGNPASTSIELSASQRKQYRQTFVGDIWIGRLCYHVTRLDREGLGPLVEFSLANKRLKAPKLHISHLIGDTESHARRLYEMLIAKAGDGETLH